jgi:LacI family transcriptional regulator/LacI family fructose operon transcriptional repressor
MNIPNEFSKKRPTIYDLAHLTGSSATAVSAVLNGSWRKRRISERLALKIMETAKQEGYAVNLQASALRRVRSNIVGMIIPKYDNRYFGALAERFEAIARSYGLFPVITCTQRDPNLELQAAKALISYQVDYLVVTGATEPDHLSKLCTVAGVRSINLDLPGTISASVTSDNFEGARQLTHLIIDRVREDLEYTGPLLFIGGRSSDHNTKERIRGFKEAHRERAIPLPEENVIASDYDPEKVEATLEARKSNLPKGVFVNSTITLEGVVRWINGVFPKHHAGIRYGCFDYDSFAALLPENVGMIEQDVNAMLTKTFDLIENGTDIREHFIIPCILHSICNGHDSIDQTRVKSLPLA